MPDPTETFLGDPPILVGPEDIIGGYYRLERLEREVGMRALVDHQAEVGIWYRLLTQQSEALARGFRFDGTEEKRRAQGLRSQLIALSLTTSRAALDMLIAGYYSIAYAAIRHMIESWSISRFVEVWPHEATSFLYGRVWCRANAEASSHAGIDREYAEAVSRSA
jgi:hypothetical protein